MIRIMLVAGDQTSKLAEYFKQRGSFDVTYSFSSISRYITNIQHQMIKVDKLVYVYQDDSINIRADMDALGKLLGSTFFSIDKIDFFVKETEETLKGIANFKFVMEECHYDNYELYKFKSAVVYASIYDSLLGVSHSANIQNSFQKVYRVEKNSDTKEIFEPDDNIAKIEPFDYKNVEKYDKAKLTTQRTESGAFIPDEGLESNIQTKFEEPVLEDLEIEGFFENRNVFIFTGNEKSGVTTNALAFSISATSADKKVTILNLQDADDAENYMNYYDMRYSKFTVKDFILKCKIGSEFMIDLLNDNEFDDNIRLASLKYVISNMHKLDTSILVIDLPKRLLNSSLKILGYKVNKIFYCTESLEKEVRKIKGTIESLVDYKSIIMLSCNIGEMDCCNRLSAEEVQEILGKKSPIISPIKYESFDLDEKLYKALVEVKR